MQLQGGGEDHEPRDAVGPESHRQHMEMLMVWGCGTWTPCPPSYIGFYNMWAFRVSQSFKETGKSQLRPSLQSLTRQQNKNPECVFPGFPFDFLYMNFMDINVSKFVQIEQSSLFFLGLFFFLLG